MWQMSFKKFFFLFSFYFSLLFQFLSELILKVRDLIFPVIFPEFLVILILVLFVPFRFKFFEFVVIILDPLRSGRSNFFSGLFYFRHFLKKTSVLFSLSF